MDSAVSSTIPFGFRPSLHSQGLPLDCPLLAIQTLHEKRVNSNKSTWEPDPNMAMGRPAKGPNGHPARIWRPDPLHPGLGPWSFKS
jgi:hypothetical protein